MATERFLQFRRFLPRCAVLAIVGVVGGESGLMYASSFMIARWKRGLLSANFTTIERRVDSGTEAREERNVALDD